MQIINADVDRVQSDALLKAQEDHDLVIKFVYLMRAQRETVVILNDDEPVYSSTSALVYGA